MNEENQYNYQNNEEMFSVKKENTSKEIAIATGAVASLIGGGIGVVSESSVVLAISALIAAVASLVKILGRSTKEKKATQNSEVE